MGSGRGATLAVFDLDIDVAAKQVEQLTVFDAAMNGFGWGEMERGRHGGIRTHHGLGHRGAKYMLRVTTILRRDDAEWKVVHRHGDPLASDAAREAAHEPVTGRR